MTKMEKREVVEAPQKARFKYTTGCGLLIGFGNLIFHGSWITAAAMGNGIWLLLWGLFIPYAIAASILRPFFGED